MPARVRVAWRALALLALAQAAQGAVGGDALAGIDAYRVAHEARIVGELDELARLPSVAADPAGLAAAAAWLDAALSRRGFQVSRWQAADVAAPVVFGELRSPGAARTVVFYAHYDGQPVSPAQWASAPFEPVMRSGPLGSGERPVDWRAAAVPFDPHWRLFGRAVSDDKASIVAFLAAFDALQAAGIRRSVNLKVVWEGEEEAGSAHLRAVLGAHRAQLAADLWLIGDGPVHQSRRPMIYFGARGMLGLDATVYGPLRPLHDGHYGNWVPNPAAMAANLIAAMRDDEGAILIPGFDADVVPLTPAERQAIALLPSMDAQLRREFGVDRTEGGESLPASLMRPAINIRGIRSGMVGEAAANAIPTEAEVSLDFRLVPAQTTAGVRERVERWLAARGWFIVDREPTPEDRLSHPRIVRLQWEAGYPALRSDIGSPAGRAVIAAAERAAGGNIAVMPMMGGSVPIYLFADLFGVPVIGLPIVNHDNNQHAANENLRLQNLWDGIRQYGAMMSALRW